MRNRARLATVTQGTPARCRLEGLRPERLTVTEPRKRKVELNLTRRDFVKIAATAAGSAVAAQAVTTGPLSPFGELKRRQLSGEARVPEAVEGPRWGMTINLDTCIGCGYWRRGRSA